MRGKQQNEIRVQLFVIPQNASPTSPFPDRRGGHLVPVIIFHDPVDPEVPRFQGEPEAERGFCFFPRVRNFFPSGKTRRREERFRWSVFFQQRFRGFRSGQNLKFASASDVADSVKTERFLQTFPEPHILPEISPSAERQSVLPVLNHVVVYAVPPGVRKHPDAGGGQGHPDLGYLDRILETELHRVFRAGPQGAVRHGIPADLVVSERACIGQRGEIDQSVPVGEASLQIILRQRFPRNAGQIAGIRHQRRLGNLQFRIGEESMLLRVDPERQGIRFRADFGEPDQMPAFFRGHLFRRMQRVDRSAGSPHVKTDIQLAGTGGAVSECE